MRAVLDPAGGQIVTEGKSRLFKPLVVMVVLTGASCQARYELPIIRPARTKQARTTSDQTSLAKID